MDPYARIQSALARINDVLNAINVLTWDARVCMPAAGAGPRAQQLATLTALAHERLVDPALADLSRSARAALGDGATLEQARTLDAVDAAVAHHARIPAELAERLALLKGTAQQAWVDARAAGDFAAFAPHLREVVTLKRELAACISPGVPAYDALMAEFEPGMTTSTLQALFAQLKATLVPLAAAIREAPEPRTDFLRRTFDPALQKSFALEVAEHFGYDGRRGRADVAPHPFEISFATSDVRITTRYDANYLPQGLFAMWHEAGHGVYEQFADARHARGALSSDLIGLYAVSGSSYGTHESQSRLWENLVGRSRPFWERFYGPLVDTFPEQLADVDVETFHRAVNRVVASPIRVEADEVTYNLHIMQRVELELALLDGRLDVDDLPGAWNESLDALLGLRPRDDREGVLQDIHWSVGLLGAFPTYTIGTVMASQFYGAAAGGGAGGAGQVGGAAAGGPDAPTDVVAAVAADVARGEYASLHAWLREHVYRHARLYTPDELLRRSTGAGLDAGPYLSYVTRKYGGLYGL